MAAKVCYAKYMEKIKLWRRNEIQTPCPIGTKYL
jgi:hypothetical protein